MCNRMNGTKKLYITVLDAVKIGKKGMMLRIIATDLRRQGLVDEIIYNRLLACAGREDHKEFWKVAKEYTGQVDFLERVISKYKGCEAFNQGEDTE